MDAKCVESIRRAADLIRSYGAVAIVGAGLSVEAGYPMLGQFEPLIRHALDEDEDCRKALEGASLRFYESRDVRLDDDTLQSLSATISDHPRARLALQRAFSKRDRELTENGAPGYMVNLARMLHQRSIRSVVSFNWDTQLEGAYAQEYGRELRPDGDWLLKPHGDAAEPKSDWILPYQPSRLDPALLERIRSLASSEVRILLVIGYSEQDEEIVRDIIGPLAERWVVLRVGPGQSAPNIGARASEALPMLCERLEANDQFPGWEYLKFPDADGLVHALSSRGMLPGDAAGCPEMAEVPQLVSQIKSNHSAFLLGKSGSGKSLISFQAARGLSKTGWEIVLLRSPQEVDRRRFPIRTLRVIDDAQNLPEKFVREIYSSANENSPILLVSNEEIHGLAPTLRVAGQRSVSALATWMRKHSAQVGPRISALDNHVGEGYLQTSIDDRIDEAAKAETPWRFNFILSGGWRRARQELADLREADNADILIFLVSGGQELTLDAGLTHERIRELWLSAGMDADEFDRALGTLKTRKLVSGGERLKCPHLRYASVVIEQMCSSEHGREKPVVRRILTSLLDVPERKLLGCQWLLYNLRFADMFRWQQDCELISLEAREWLTRQIWFAEDPEQIRVSLFLLQRLELYLPDYWEILEANVDVLVSRVQNSNETTAYAVGDLVNWLSQKQVKVFDEIFSRLSPAATAALFNQLAPQNLFVFGHLIGRLGACAPSKWTKTFARHLPWKHFESVFTKVTLKEVYGAADFVHEQFNLRCKWDSGIIDILLPKLASAINKDAVKAARSVDFEFWIYLGLRHFRRMWDLVSPESVANAISRAKPRDWQPLHLLISSFHRGHPVRCREISSDIDYNRLLASSNEISDPHQRELISILFYLHEYSSSRPVRSWLKSSSSNLLFVSREMAIIVPLQAVRLLRGGQQLTLRMDGNYWGVTISGRALQSLYRVDFGAAESVLRHNLSELSDALLVNPKQYSHDGVSDFLDSIESMAPQILDSAVSDLDPELARVNWSAVSSDPDSPLQPLVRKIGALARRTEGAVAEVAAELLL